MKLNLKSIKFNRKQIIASLLVIVSIILIILNYSQPQIITISPTPNSQNVPLNQPLVITFDKNINPKNIEVFSDPPEKFTLSLLTPNQIKAEHSKSFLQNTQYFISIRYRNKAISTFVFHTKTSQNEPRLLQEIEELVNQQYPLAQYTPYQTPNFRVVYTAPLTLEIQLKTPNISPDKATNQVKAWVKLHQQDPNSHRYIVKPFKPQPATI